MKIINVKLFGTPLVTKDNVEVLFPYSKVKALFYYLVINKRASRDELCGLLWCDDKDDIAKKNLRNAIYKIKKSFDEDIVISPDKSMVILNPDMKISSDTDLFDNDDVNIFEVYSGDFLQGFFVKDSQEFEDWTRMIRENYKESFIRKIYNCIHLDLQEKNVSNIEMYCKKLIEVNEFDEKAYRTLMKFYKSNKNYKNAISIYNKLSAVLSKELGIKPDKKTRLLFNEILDCVNDSSYNNNQSSKEFFFGRENELRLMEQNFEKFSQGKVSKSLIISGEAGIGKSRLKDEFLSRVNTEDILIFQTNCYIGEKKFFLKPWNSIISQIYETLINDKISIPPLWENILSSVFPNYSKSEDISYASLMENLENLKYDMIGDIICDIFDKISVNKKIILIFEDLQYADSISISLLNTVSLHQKKSDLIFIATYRNEYDEYVENLITSLKLYDKLIHIHLNRFSKGEVDSFIKNAHPKYPTNRQILDKIYEETEGNTFFVTEYINILKSNGNINIMSSKMQDVIKSKFLYLSEESNKILNITSLFFDEAPLKILSDLTGFNELYILDIVEELEKKYILMEIKDLENISFKFTHQKLREFVYMKQSEGKKKLLHNKIGNLLESYLKNTAVDTTLYHKLIYHYKNADNEAKALKYQIKVLNSYLNFSHELFPILTRTEYEDYKFTYFNKHDTISNFKEVENMLKIAKKKEGATEEIIKLEIAYLHLKGRYLIREGEYETGTKLIQDMISKAIDIEYKDYALEGYKQMIFFYIQTFQKDLMIKYIELGIDLALDLNYHKEVGILLRLKGLYKIMCEKYEEAEKLLNESINTFNITKQVAEKYSLNIAAAYNYIGEIRRFQMNFEDAIIFYEKAISICESKNSLVSLAVFNINAGQAAFDMGDYEKAKDYFQKSDDLYSKVDSIWRRSVEEAFMSLILCKEGNYTESLKYLKKAVTHSNKIKNPHEIGIVYRVKAEISVAMLENDTLKKIFAKYLKNKPQYYCNQAINNLTKSNDAYEIEIVNSLNIS